MVQSRKRAKKTAAAKGGAPQGGALKQRDRMLSQVKAYQRLRPEDRRALLTDKVCMLQPSSLWQSCPHPYSGKHMYACSILASPVSLLFRRGPCRS